MGCLGSEIVRGNKPRIADLSLQAEVPLRHFHVMQVIVHGGQGAEIRPWRIRILRDIPSLGQRERISPGVICPWIIHVDVTGQCIPGIEGRAGTQANHIMRVRKVVEGSARRAQ